MTHSTPERSTPARGRLLGIDHGTKVIGLAICDAAWIAARPLQLLTRQTRAADFARIAAIVQQQQVTAIVVGLPEQPADYAGPGQASTVRRWASRLAAAMPVPVYLWDEQFSTFEAEQITAELGADTDTDRRNRRIDDRAAAVILQSFINAHPPGTPLPPPIKQIH